MLITLYGFIDGIESIGIEWKTHIDWKWISHLNEPANATQTKLAWNITDSIETILFR